MSGKRKTVEYIESWYRTWCPYCDIDNWHCNGNEQDLSGVDVDGIKCRNCGKEYLLGPEDKVWAGISGRNYKIENGRKMIDNKSTGE